MARSIARMRDSALHRHLLPRALFRPAATAWLTVLTILFCAMLPAGLPLSTAHGSAFNPATTSVALASQRPERRAIAQRSADPDEATAAPWLAKAFLPQARPALIMPVRSRGIAFAADYASGLRLEAVRGARHARAPPQA